MLVPLHAKSQYSLGCGTASVAELAERAARTGLPALALTDLENLYGQVRFHHACRERGVRPLTGVELRPGFDGQRRFGSRAGRVVLLARDRTGYESLCRMVSRRRARGDEGGDPLWALAGSADGLFVMTDDPAALERLVATDAVDRSCLRLLLVRPGSDAATERRLFEASRRHGVPLVADPDVVMLDRADRPLHVLQMAIRRVETVVEVRRGAVAEAADRHLPPPAELERLFADVPEAVAETRRLAERCELDLLDARPVFPPPNLPPGETPDAHLRRTCARELERCRAEGRCAGSAYERRLEEELAVVERLGFSGYFLVVGEIVGHARGRGIQVAGRGSAVGSLLAHVLGITQVDPLAHGLYFERFLHERRHELPDIDIDLCSTRRDEVIDWVYRRFGRDRVAMVSAHHTFRQRSAYREGLKALGMPPEEVDRLCGRIPADDLAAALEDAEAAGGAVAAAGEPPALPPGYRDWAPFLERLVGAPRLLAVHPGGVVIADRAIDTYAPLELAPKGVVVTQYDLQSVEHTGLVKIDLLGNRCLSELQETIGLVAAGDRRPRARDLAERGLAGIPADDPATLGTLGRAETLGCFQVESPAMRSALAQIPIRSLRDCVAALAIVRPGAASGSAKDAFIRRANGEERIEFLHPSLEERLRETYGILLYEEDIMCVLSILGRMSLSEADELRAAIVACRDDAGELERLGSRFAARAAENGLAPAAAAEVWRTVLKFAAYSFSKAHATSYALLAYQAAYLKTHFPAEFGCAVLNHHGGLYPLRTLAAEVGRWGVAVLPPCVNRSGYRCTVERPRGEPAVRVGFEKVKWLSKKTVVRLIDSRNEAGPFRDVADLLRRVPLARAELESLVLSGACDDLPPLSPSLYPFAHQALLAGGAAEAAATTAQSPPARAPSAHSGALSGGGEAASAPVTLPPVDGDRAESHRLETYRSLVRVRDEVKYLQMHPSGHPMRVLRAEAERYGCLTTAEAARSTGTIRFAGLVAATRRVATKDGGVMQFITFEDEHGLLEAVLFPGAYRRLGDRITTAGPFLATGTVQREQGDVHLVVSALDPFYLRQRLYRPRREEPTGREGASSELPLALAV